MIKRKNGEGHYGEKKIKGYMYKFYRDAQGNYTYGKTSKELQNKLKEKKNAVKLAAPKGNLTTFGEICDEWLPTMLKKLSPGTYDHYESVIKSRLKNYTDYDLSNKQAKSLTIDMVNEYFDSLAKKYSKGSIDKTWIVIKQALFYGMSEEKIPNFDLSKVRRPKESEVAVKKKEISFITLDDMELLYQESKRVTNRGTNVYGDAAQVLVFIMYSGLRLGEAIGLTWKYVDKNYESIKVARSNRRIIARNNDGKAILNEKGQNTYVHLQKEPKTETGVRTIPLPERAKEVLRYFEGLRNGSDYVFLNSNMQIFEKRAVERTLSRMLKNSNCSCKDYTPHSLRHGYGSVLISKGVDIKIVSELLGHTDVAFTYNVYIGILKEDKINAIKNVFDN